MVERFTQTTCPTREGQPKNREAGLRDIEMLGIAVGQRSCLNALFREAWPENQPADFKPLSWVVPIKIEDLGQRMGGLKRTATKSHLDPLVARGLVIVIQTPGKPNGLQINWQRIYEVGESRRSTPPTPPEASGPLHPEASGGVDEEPGVIERAIYRAANHIANRLTAEIREGFQRLIDTGVKPEASTPPVTDAEASGALRRPPTPPDSPKLINELTNKLNPLIDSFINDPFGGVEASAPPEASGGARRGSSRSTEFRWSNELREIRPDKLRDPAHVDRMLDYVRSIGFWEYPGDFRTLFFATVIESIKIAELRKCTVGGVLTNKIRSREIKPATDESYAAAKAELAKLGRVKDSPAVSELQKVFQAKQRELRQAGLGHGLPDPTAVQPAIDAVMRVTETLQTATSASR